MPINNIENFKKYVSVLDPSILPSSECNYYTEQEFNTLCQNKLPNSPPSISFFHINIRSLNANHSKLTQLLACLNHNFDAIILSEIWSFNISMYKNLFKNYNFYFSLPNNSNICGIGIYVHQSFSINERNDISLNLLGYNHPIESLFLELQSERYHSLSIRWHL